jgi:hypothetical protein
MSTEEQVAKIIQFITSGNYIAVYLGSDTHPINWLDEMSVIHNYSRSTELGPGGYLVMIDYNQRYSFSFLCSDATLEAVRLKMVKHSRYGRVLYHEREADKELIENVLFPTYEWKDKSENAYILFENIRDTHEMASMGMRFSKDYLETCISFCVQNELFRESNALQKLLSE